MGSAKMSFRALSTCIFATFLAFGNACNFEDQMTFLGYDLDQNGHLDLNEFCKAIKYENQNADCNIEFKKADFNKDEKVVCLEALIDDLVPIENNVVSSPRIREVLLKNLISVTWLRRMKCCT